MSWKVGPAAASHSWDVVLEAAIGTGAALELRTIKDQRLTGATLDTTGDAHLYDLRLAPGTYLLRVIQGAGMGAQPYVLRSIVTDAPNSDPEPDDDLFDAAPIVVGSLVRGRLARSGDIDQYLLHVDDALSARLLDLRLILRSGPGRTVCLSEVDPPATVRQLKCVQAPAPTPADTQRPNAGTLQDLLLQPGRYLISVSGDASPADTYGLRLDATSKPAPDFETEPDDSPTSAVPMAPTTVMHGVAVGGDPDVYRVTATEPARTWTLRVSGTLLDGLVWLDGDGTILATGDVAADRSTAVLSDVYLPPGEHLFQVTAEGGAYTLAFAPQGPSDAAAEREPNNDAIHAQPILLDQRVVGRLPQSSDVDVYRFSLTAVDHLRVRLTVPPDGALVAELRHAGQITAAQTDRVVGGGWDYDAVLQPGDYELWLHSQVASQASYQLGVEREDPFTLRIDQEPNDSPVSADPMPPSLTIDGSRDASSDQDWFRVDPLDRTGTIVVRTTGDVTTLGVSDGTTEMPVAEAPDGDGLRFSVGPVPAGVALYLHILPAGDYTATVLSGLVAPTGPRIPTAAAAASVSIELSDTSIAAYWDAGQRIRGTVTVADTGPTAETLLLDAVTTHYAWAAHLDQDRVEVAPGQRLSVPITISVLPDAWADIPVRYHSSRTRCIRSTGHRVRRGETGSDHGTGRSVPGLAGSGRPAGRHRRGGILGRWLAGGERGPPAGAPPVRRRRAHRGCLRRHAGWTARHTDQRPRW